MEQDNDNEQNLHHVGPYHLRKEKKELFDPTGKVGTICRDHCMDNNLIMRAVRDGMMCSPPLSISKDDIDKCVERLKISLDATLKDIKKLNI